MTAPAAPDADAAPGFGSARRAGFVAAFSIASVGSGLFLPLSLVYFTARTDIPLADLGALLSTAGLVTLVVPLAASALVVRLGARRLTVLALAMQCAAYLGYLVAVEAWSVLLVSIAMSLGVRLYWSVVFAAISEVADASGARRPDGWYAIANIARTAGLGVGGLVAGVAITAGGASDYLFVAAASAVCFAVAALLFAVTAPRSRGGSGGIRFAEFLGPLRDGRFLGYTALNGLFATAQLFLGLKLPTLVLHGLHGPGWATSALLVANALLIAALGAPVVRRTAGRNRVRVLRLVAVLWGCGWLVVALAAGLRLPLGWSLALLAVAVALASLAEVAHAPTSMALAAELAADAAPERARGAYLAIFQYAFIIAELVGPVLFGGLFGVWHPAPFVAVAAIVFAGGGLLRVVGPALLRRRGPA